MIVRKTTRIEWHHQSTMLSNQSIKIRIWFIILQNLLLHQYEHALLLFVQWLIVFLSICSLYLFDNCTSQHFNIFVSIYSTTFSTIARVFYSLQFEKDSEIHALTNQIDVFFSSSFETTFRFVVNIILFICSTFFFNNRSNIHSHHNLK